MSDDDARIEENGIPPLPPLPGMQAVIDAFPQYVLLVDDEHRIHAANERLCEQLGVRREALIGKRCPSAVHGVVDGGAFPGCPLDTALRTGKAASREVEDGLRGISTLSSVYPILAENGRRLWLHTGLDVTSRKQAELREREAVRRLHATLDATVSVTTRAVEAKHPYTAGHQRRVARLAAAIAGKLMMPASEVETVRSAGQVHDLGKIGIPSDILNKPGRLTAEEYDLIKQHPEIGYSILEPVEFPSPIAAHVLQHHERMDGSGYPRGLAGDEITPEARIIAVADVVEAMSLDRPYRPALGVDVALATVAADRGTLFDREAVDACRALFSEGFTLFETATPEAAEAC